MSGRISAAWRRLREPAQVAWQLRERLAEPPAAAYAQDFLPAADALRERPPHPAPRVLLWSLVTLALLALSWSLLGRVDVVSVAPGKVLAHGRNKPVQAEGLAVVKAVRVAEGQRVRAGQRLVELDASLPAAELEQLHAQWQLALSDQARAHALLEALARHAAPTLAHVPELDVDARQALATRIHADYDALRTQLDQADSVVAQREADIAAARAAVRSLQQSLPISRQMASDYRGLLEGRYVAKHAWLERERQVLQQQQELAAQQARLAQHLAARTQAAQQRDAALAEARRHLLEQGQQAAQRVYLLAQERRKARHRDALALLDAPVAGTVQQLAVHAPGAVVTPAQTLLVIVPDEAPVEVEAQLSNRDIGFVRVGQRARIKIDTYDFTRFGVLGGRVASISPDAVADPQAGAVYRLRIRLDASHLQAQGRALAITPGMSVRAEIHTGDRRLISYFLSPLHRHLDESLVER